MGRMEWNGGINGMDRINLAIEGRYRGGKQVTDPSRLYTCGNICIRGEIWG